MPRTRARAGAAALLLAAACALLRPEGLTAGLLAGPPAAVPRVMPPVRAAKAAEPKAAEPASGLAAGYLLGGGATMGAWAACAYGALATYKPERVLHNSIGVSQALTALPLIWAVFSALRASAQGGRQELQRPEVRRLNLGMAAASVWSAITVVWSPEFTAAVVRTADPVIYPLPLRVAATAVHLGVAALCLGAWRGALASAGPWRVVSGFLGSLWLLGPRQSAQRNRPKVRGSEFSTLTIAFGCFAALAVFAPFPLATVPSLLGKRMARAFGAWLFLAAVVFFVLKNDADGGGAVADSTSRPLKVGVALMALPHLALAAARPALETVAVYPAAMACRPAVVASWLVYALAVAAVAKQ